MIKESIKHFKFVWKFWDQLETYSVEDKNVVMTKKTYGEIKKHWQHNHKSFKS